MSDYDTQIQVEEQYDSLKEEFLRDMGTFAGEPANEDKYNTEDLYSYADGYEL